jgi:hypothetical protein
MVSSVPALAPGIGAVRTVSFSNLTDMVYLLY